MDAIRISVRNLVEFLFRSGDITGGDGVFVKDAMMAGSRIHRKIQGSMGSEYEAEVPLSVSVDRAGFTLVLQGRADGIWREQDGVVIDEIKGIYKKLEYLDAPVPVHRAQAMCYAYIYAKQYALEEIGIRMIYCNLDTEEQKYFRETFSFDEIAAWFEEVMCEYDKWAQMETEHRTRRDASLQRLEFPYAYREGQKAMAATVYCSIRDGRHLFVQAPTGIGKTMAAMYPALKAIGNGYGEKLFYLTAKTIAGTVAEDGLAVLRDRGLYFHSIMLTAKEKLCPLEEMQCDARTCPYAKGHYDRINAAIYACVTQEYHIARRTLLSYAKTYMVCPFELGLDASLFVDGIICDYNYVFDPRVKLKRYFAESVNGDYIFLVDEAHNLVERASAMYSAQLCKEDFLYMRRLLAPYQGRIGRQLLACNRELLEYKRMCDETGSYVILQDIGGLTGKLLRLHTLMEAFLEEGKETEALKPHWDAIMNFYFQLHQFLNVYELVDDSYEIYAEQEGAAFRVRLYCVHPANNIRLCVDKGVATIFFSATMLPILYYKELLHDTEDPAIYIPSPFPREHRRIFTATDVSSRYRDRGSSMYARIAQYLEVLVSGRKGNYMAFFPSYRMLEDVYAAAREKGLFAGMKVISQTPNLGEEERNDFLQSFSEDGEPVLGLCILGGIFSEGIDLTGNRLIGAAIVGTGLPMVCTQREILQRYFDRRQGSGFEYAYLYPGMNKVQQAAGRVIRTMDDRGVILLLDDRFVTPQVVHTFPAEWDDYEPVTLATAEQKIASAWEQIPDDCTQQPKGL